MKRLLHLIVCILFAGCGSSSSDGGSAAYTPGSGICGEGSGTAKSPFVLCSSEDMELLQSNPAAYFVLESNIMLNSEWTPVGSRTLPFTGHIDGLGHTISGLYVNGDNYAGLLGAMSGGSAANLSIELATSGINGSIYVGGIAGWADNSTIYSCSVSGDLTGVNEVGGIVGYARNSTIKAVRSDGSINSDGTTGGIAGTLYKSALLNSYSLMNIYSNNIFGGIVGLLKQGNVMYCYSGAVEIVGTDSASTIIGGIAGRGTNSQVIATVSNAGRLHGQRLVNKITGETDGYTSSDNLALASMTVFGTQIDGDKGTPATASEISDITTYQNLGWQFGGNPDNPWIGESGPPKLYFDK